MNTFEILDKIVKNPDSYKLYATGIKEYYEENKCIFNDEMNIDFISYDKIIDKEFSLSKDSYVFVFRINEKETKVLSDKGYKVFNFYDMVDYRSKIFWDSKKTYVGVDLNHYQSNPINRDMINSKSKLPSTDAIILKYFKEKTDLKILSLGCGTGYLERVLAKTIKNCQIDAMDISSESIKECEKLSKQEGLDQQINYRVGNLNKDRFDINTYDVVVADSCIHHVENLEFMYSSVYASLKENGLFIQREFVGESHFQWSKTKLKTVNMTLKLMPKILKIRRKYKKPSYEDMMRCDPSEGIRSSEIIEKTKEYFKIEEEIKAYGTVLHLLYQCVNTKYFHNENGTPIFNKLLSRLLCWYTFKKDKKLMQEGIYDHTTLIARKK